ncbi:MAG: hypothetical protein AVDCRST_MAG90-3439 [uncultured Microvirga sp.]|uniref:Uncharacterized protein n=1 Tax=uncultured Microvirga sp. TaxID=412392 RepID=A0A6J4MTH8_9HYPH|nr:MAG: hypothetical protein AVDCRST_MAG90-3439 [uncultured Microvirga sp.]
MVAGSLPRGNRLGIASPQTQLARFWAEACSIMLADEAGIPAP